MEMLMAHSLVMMAHSLVRFIRDDLHLTPSRNRKMRLMRASKVQTGSQSTVSMPVFTNVTPLAIGDVLCLPWVHDEDDEL